MFLVSFKLIYDGKMKNIGRENKTTMDSFGLFHQLFEPLKIHQTISNSNQTIHKTLYLMKVDKSGPKNNNFGSLI